MSKNNNLQQEQLKKIGERLRELRKRKGYSNYEIFAFDNDIARAQYGRYEKGSDLKISSLIKVLNALDITLNEFFDSRFDVKST